MEGAGADETGRPVVIRAIGDDELQLVSRPERLEILPSVAIALPASGALDVDDPPHALRNVLDRQAAAGLEHHFETPGQKRPHQIDRLGLKERLPSRQLDQLAVVGFDAIDDLANGHGGAFMESVGVSHQTQRRLQPVRRTKTQGRPAWVDSPWIEWKISLTRSIPRIVAEGLPEPPPCRRPPRGTPFLPDRRDPRVGAGGRKGMSHVRKGGFVHGT